MKPSLLDALEAVKKNSAIDDGKVLECALYCGFTPLHLQTFFHAALCGLSGNRRVLIQEGTYADLLGSLLGLISKDIPLEFVAVAMEWDDFDARLGLRSSSGWSHSSHASILESVHAKSALFSDCLQRLAERTKVVLSLPSSPLLPLHYSVRGGSNPWESELRAAVSSWTDYLLPQKNFRLFNMELLSTSSSYASRYSAESHLAYGFPYSMDFASDLGRELAMLALPPTPLKGVIVDLDETLWKGILGDDGVEGVSWDLDHGSHIHAVFQAFLQSLAEVGILVAVASKNDPDLVEELFVKRSPLLRRDSVFPLMAGWGRKSNSIRKVLEAWNIAADAVVFVDDNPLEIEEVRAELPDVNAFLFPSGRADAVLSLISTLRDLFGKDEITEEDSIRMQSLKQRDVFLTAEVSGGENYEELLRQNESVVTLRFLSEKGDARAFELLNKTNQFNMNGVRCTEGEWKKLCSRENGFVLVCDYEDRFGPLGKIAVMAGYVDGDRVLLTHWVMSCRAFGRRIEHCMLKCIFEKYGVEEMGLEFSPTERNKPFRTFASEAGAVLTERCMGITRAVFFEKCPPLYHEVREGWE